MAEVSPRKRAFAACSARRARSGGADSPVGANVDALLDGYPLHAPVELDTTVARLAHT
jgi:hypothetical protein